MCDTQTYFYIERAKEVCEEHGWQLRINTSYFDIKDKKGRTIGAYDTAEALYHFCLGYDIGYSDALNLVEIENGEDSEN